MTLTLLPVQSEARTLGTSNFKRIHSDEKSRSNSAPRHQHEVFSALHSFLMAYARLHNLQEAAAEDLFQRLQRDVLQDQSGVEDALNDIARMAQRIWSSDHRLKEVSAEYQLEFCSILNSGIRSDDPDLIMLAMPIILAINSLCVVRGARPERLLKFPTEHKCYRGSGIPDEHLAFFTAGLKYRIPAYFASSFKRQADLFIAVFQGIEMTHTNCTCLYAGS
jgi:hypothetical protein